MPPLARYLRRDPLLLRSSVTREWCCPAAARPSRVPQVRPVVVLARVALVPVVALVAVAVLPSKALPAPSVPAARLLKGLRSPLQADPGQSRRAVLALQPSLRAARPPRPLLAHRSSVKPASRRRLFRVCPVVGVRCLPVSSPRPSQAFPVAARRSLVGPARLRRRLCPRAPPTPTSTTRLRPFPRRRRTRWVSTRARRGHRSRAPRVASSPSRICSRRPAWPAPCRTRPRR